MFEKQANSGHGQQGRHETAGELLNIYIYFLQVASRMAVTPRGHRHCGRATKIFNSKPTTVTANEGTRLWASYLFCLLKAGQMAVKPRGQRQGRRATKILNSKPTAVMANEGTRLRASDVGRAKGRVDVTTAQP